MLDHKTYMDISSFKTKFADSFKKGDYIIIQEKIDGANASWEYDKETDSMFAFSRKNTLDCKNNLRGFWEFTQSLNIGDYKEDGIPRVFCEWLVSHSVPYPQDRYQKAYVYDLYNSDTKEYLHQDKVKQFCMDKNLIYVPVLYEGEFVSWDHLLTFVGQTELGGEYGEGIVVKNMTRLNDPNGRIPFYIKIVGEKFKEKADRKGAPIDPEVLKEREYKIELTNTIVTLARVQKILHKFVDEGLIPEDWDETNMGVIAKNITKDVYYDCVKEEKDTVDEIGDTFGKFCSSRSMCLVKEILSGRSKKEVNGNG